MLDRYVFGSVSRISPEAPIPVVQYKNETDCLGGAANVANNLMAMGCEVTLLAVTGEDESSKKVLSLLADSGIGTDGILFDLDRTTTEKTRIVAQNHQQLLRIDREDTHPLSFDMEAQLINKARDMIREVDMVTLSDYNKGVLTERVCQEIIRMSNLLGKKVMVDPKSANIAQYSGAWLIKPNHQEWLQLFKGETHPGIMLESMQLMKQKLNTQAFLVTMGQEGIFYIDEHDETEHVATKQKQVYDATGCGDTVCAMLSACLANDVPLSDAARLANIAAGLKLEKAGAAIVGLEELIWEVVGQSNPFAVKIISEREDLITKIQELKNKKQKIVFTNGCYDILHYGHIGYLNKAKTLGDILIVGVNTDDSIQRLKGDKRPIVGLKERMGLLAALQCVDYVVPFSEDTPYRIIKDIIPDILVKGMDYRLETVVGRDVVEKNGGSVHLMALEPGISTSNIIERILKLYGGECK